MFLSYIKNINVEFKKYLLIKREEDLKPCSCGKGPRFYYNYSLAKKNPNNPLLIIVRCPDCYRHTHVTTKPNLAIKSWNSDIIDEDMIDKLDITMFHPIF